MTWSLAAAQHEWQHVDEITSEKTDGVIMVELPVTVMVTKR